MADGSSLPLHWPASACTPALIHGVHTGPRPRAHAPPLRAPRPTSLVHGRSPRRSWPTARRHCFGIARRLPLVKLLVLVGVGRLSDPLHGFPRHVATHWREALASPSCDQGTGDGGGRRRTGRAAVNQGLFANIWITAINRDLN